MADNTLFRMRQTLNCLFDLCGRLEWYDNQDPGDPNVKVWAANLTHDIKTQKSKLRVLMHEAFGSDFTQQHVDSFVSNFIEATKRSYLNAVRRTGSQSSVRDRGR